MPNEKLFSRENRRHIGLCGIRRRRFFRFRSENDADGPGPVPASGAGVPYKYVDNDCVRRRLVPKPDLTTGVASVPSRHYLAEPLTDETQSASNEFPRHHGERGARQYPL